MAEDSANRTHQRLQQPQNGFEDRPEHQSGLPSVFHCSGMVKRAQGNRNLRTLQVVVWRLYKNDDGEICLRHPQTARVLVQSVNSRLEGTEFGVFGVFGSQAWIPESNLCGALQAHGPVAAAPGALIHPRCSNHANVRPPPARSGRLIVSPRNSEATDSFVQHFVPRQKWHADKGCVLFRSRHRRAGQDQHSVPQRHLSELTGIACG